MKKVLINTALVAGSVFFAYALVEIYVRAQMYDRYVNAKYPMAASNKIAGTAPANAETKSLAWNTPNGDFHYWRIDEDSRILFKTAYHANNLGLVSLRDQPVARQEKEFRIVVIGDSFTAAIEMETPWPDILEDNLNADTALREKLGGARVRVYNFGYPAGGFLDFKQMAENAKILDPDMVVVNFIEADFQRCNNCFEQDEPADSRPPLQLVSGQIAFPVEGESGVPKVSVTCERPPVSFDTSTCRHSFALDAPASIVENPEKLKALKQRILKEFVRGQLWTSPYPYAIRAAMGKPVSLSELRNAEKYVQKPRKARVLTEDDVVAQAADVLENVRTTWPRTLFTRHPVYEDLIGKGTDNLTQRLVAEHPSLHVVDMRGYLPMGLEQPEYYGWFCLPADGHMNQRGGQRFAQGMAKAIEAAILTAKTQ
jgi:hypothetical protein